MNTGMNRTMRKLALVSLLVAGGWTSTLQAQNQGDTLNLDVTFIGNREMLLQDAHKLLAWPTLRELGVDKPVFNYELLPKRMVVEPTFEYVEAKRVDVTPPLPLLYRGYARLGFGMYVSPVAELSFTDLRNRKSNWGIQGTHRSSNGGFDVRDSIPERFSNSELNAWAKRFWKRETLTFRGFVGQQGISYLGLDSLTEVPAMADDRLRERFGSWGASVHSESTRKDSGDWAIEADLAYRHLWAQSGVTEHTGLTSGLASTYREGLEMRLNWEGVYNRRRVDSVSSTDQVVFNVNPEVVKTSGALRTALGAAIVVDARGNRPFQVFPTAEASLQVLKGIMVPYARIGGDVENNRLATVLADNPYANPELELQNTYRRFDFRAGLRGHVTSHFHYHARFSVEHFEQYLYFVNDSNAIGGSQFAALYDTLTVSTLGGDARLMISDEFTVFGGVDLKTYATRGQIAAWNLPNMVWRAGLHYNWHDKFTVDANVEVVGARSAASLSEDATGAGVDLGAAGLGAQRDLPAFVDANLKLEYLYNKRMSAWITCSNLVGGRYQMWNNYPVQGFLARFGATYAF